MGGIPPLNVQSSHLKHYLFKTYHDKIENKTLFMVYSNNLAHAMKFQSHLKFFEQVSNLWGNLVTKNISYVVGSLPFSASKFWI